MKLQILHETTMEGLKAVAERIRLIKEELLNTEYEKSTLLNKLLIICQKEEQLNEKLSEESRIEENMLKTLATRISGDRQECKLSDIEIEQIFDTGNVKHLNAYNKINNEELTANIHCINNAGLDTPKSVVVQIENQLATSAVSKVNVKETFAPITNQSNEYTHSSVGLEEMHTVNEIISSDVKRKRKCIKKENQKTSMKAVDNSDCNKLHCDICKKVFQRRWSYELHVSSHNNKTATYGCSECNSAFTLPNQLVKHQREHSKTSSFTCNRCDKDLKTSQLYSNHMRMHSGEKPFECTVCDKRFSLKYSLETHQRLHSGTRDHLCSICGKGYVNNCELTKHMATHSLQYSCDVCHKRFANSRRLETHRLVHTDQRPFVCNVCGRAVRTSKALTVHFHTHYKIKAHACKICDRTFQQAGNLKAHIRTHTGESAFSCRECGLKFRNGYNLKIHLLTHTDALPTTFSCTVCDKKFIGRGILKAHLLTHSSETPHKCDECDKQYKRPIDLRIHKRKMHNSVVIKQRP